jgi:hypothetical protein
VADQVVRPTQMALMQGIYILYGVVTLHETIHELHRKKMNDAILKIDFEKAYDKVKWSFLQQTLWRALIHNFIFGVSVVIKVNNDVGSYFQTKKGFTSRQPIITHVI